jgi:hypothetical protein
MATPVCEPLLSEWKKIKLPTAKAAVAAAVAAMRAEAAEEAEEAAASAAAGVEAERAEAAWEAAEAEAEAEAEPTAAAAEAAAAAAAEECHTLYALVLQSSGVAGVDSGRMIYDLHPVILDRLPTASGPPPTHCTMCGEDGRPMAQYPGRVFAKPTSDRTGRARLKEHADGVRSATPALCYLSHPSHTPIPPSHPPAATAPSLPPRSPASPLPPASRASPRASPPLL